MSLRVIIVFTAALLLAGTAAAETPKVEGELPHPLPLPYDEGADAHGLVRSAIERAGAQHKYVLLDFGGNWCPDCRVVAGVLSLPSVQPAVERTFEMVEIDVGRMNRNLDIAQNYGVRIQAVPTLIVLDPAGRMVNAGNPAALSDARTLSPQEIVDTIFGWVEKKG
jgi:thiol-disulfide isomerase/thioredoxin